MNTTQLAEVSMVAGRNFYDDPWHERAQIFLRGVSADGRVYFCSDLTWTERNLGSVEQPPKMVTLQAEAAQRLMNSLWELGFRPAQAAGSAGQLDAVKQHLFDLQRIVFKDYPAKPSV